MPPTGELYFREIFSQNFSQIINLANIFLSVRDYPRETLHLSGQQEEKKAILCLITLPLLLMSIDVLAGQ